MLTEDQIDYLFQIRDSKPAIPPDTVRVMLKALRWTPDEIEHGIDFLNRPDAKDEPEPEPARAEASAPAVPVPLMPKPVKIKQNPFPVGSPFAKSLKEKETKRHRRLIIAGAIAGFIFFVLGVLLYARFAI